MRCFHSITQADQITQLAMLLQQCSRVSNRKTIHWFKVTDLCYVTTISKSKEGSRCFFKKLHLESFMLILQISSRLLQINYLIHVSERHLMTGQCFKVQYPRLTVNATGRFEAANKSARDQKFGNNSVWIHMNQRNTICFGWIRYLTRAGRSALERRPPVKHLL